MLVWAGIQTTILSTRPAHFTHCYTFYYVTFFIVGIYNQIALRFPVSCISTKYSRYSACTNETMAKVHTISRFILESRVLMVLFISLLPNYRCTALLTKCETMQISTFILILYLIIVTRIIKTCYFLLNHFLLDRIGENKQTKNLKIVAIIV